MKRFFCIVLSVLFLAGITGCNSDGGGLLPLLGLGGSSEESSDPSTMKYLEYMYDNENGRRLSDQAMSGMPDTDEFRAELGEYLAAPFIESLGQSGENAESANWWERLDISAEGVAVYLGTESGKRAMEEYMGAGSGEKASIVPGQATGGPSKNIIDETGATIEGLQRAMNLISDMPAFLTWNNIMMAGFWVFNQFNNINQQLDEIQTSIEEGFEQTLFRLDMIEGWLKEQDLIEAKTTINAKIKSFANLEGYDDTSRRSVVKEFFSTEHQVLFEQAYNSAKEIAAYMNSRASSADYRYVPGNMLYSHMIFMRQMSDLRLTYAPVFYSRNDLLRFRANWAESDLAMLKEIKDAFLSDPRCTEDYDYYRKVSLLLASWEIQLRAHMAIVDEADVLGSDLEDARNVVIDEAFGTFGDLNGIPGIGSCGEQLSTDAGAPIAGVFPYGTSLESMFDAGTSGALGNGRFIRIVHSGKNLMADLGLEPIMRSLLGPNRQMAPGKGQFYIDPALGRFILPRPDYWSRMETVENMVEPELRDYNKPVMVLTSGSLSAVPGKENFGNCIELNSRGASMWDLYPFGTSGMSQQGTLSAWWNPDGSWDYYFKIFISGENTYVSVKNNCVKIFIDGAERFTKNIPGLDRQWNHVYVVWDRAQSLANNLKSVRVFINGVEEGSCADIWMSYGVFFCRAESHMGILESNNKVDNIKIWKHVVLENPEWEFRRGSNGIGRGREKALHAIYGPDSNAEYDYRPKLTGSGNGVGYYYVQ